MADNYYVRTGVWAEIFPFRADDGLQYRRGQRVICRTGRGVEVGEVVSPAEREPVGTLLRPMTGEDELLQLRLEKYKRKAVENCRRRLSDAGFDTVLLEVEHLFDGRTLLFHFLGDVPDEVEQMTEELANDYEQQVRSKHFAKLLSEGCGPGCGTKDKGCSGGCAVCVVAGACSSAGNS